MEILDVVLTVAEAALAIIGGLKLLARYTKTEADDRLLAAIEAPIKVVRAFFKRDKN
jgi:hypothetical protein